MRIALGVFAIYALAVAPMRAGAQPYPEATSTPREMGGGGNTKIPVTMPGSTEVLGAESTAVSASAAPISLEQPIDPDKYVCGPGDVFELNFLGQQNFRLRIAADLEGRAFISKVGFVPVAGKTLTAVRKEVAKKVRGNYPGLSFELALISPRSFLVHIVNYVKQPGSYSATPLERVSNLLTRAGGVTGSRRRIVIKHKGGTETPADLVLYELTGDTAYNPYVLDGDVIVVPFADVVATIEGAVRRPGRYELTKTRDLDEALTLAGGFTSSVARSLPIRIVRRNAKVQDEFVDVPFRGDAAPNHDVIDGDRVIVRGADDLQRSVLLIGAISGADSLDATTTSRRLPYVEGDTVLSLLERAGGIKAPGDLRRSYITRPHENGSQELIAIDLDALLVRRDFKSDKPVKMGDTIVIPPMQYSIRVQGAVGRPGLYNYNPLFGVPEYIAHAGGRTRSAESIDDAIIIDSNGSTRPYRKGAKPSPGDAILIPERNFTRAEVVQLVFAGAGLILSGVAITLAATR